MKEISVGDQLDHYRVDALVATGSHASIFRAFDLKDGAVVAIKVPHAELEMDPVFSRTISPRTGNRPETKSPKGHEGSAQRTP